MDVHISLLILTSGIMLRKTYGILSLDSISLSYVRTKSKLTGGGCHDKHVRERERDRVYLPNRTWEGGVYLSKGPDSVLLTLALHSLLEGHLALTSTLALLQEPEISPEVLDYLEGPHSSDARQPSGSLVLEDVDKSSILIKVISHCLLFFSKLRLLVLDAWANNILKWRLTHWLQVSSISKLVNQITLRSHSP